MSTRPNFHTNPLLKYAKCHISTNLVAFLRLFNQMTKNYLSLIQQMADSLTKIGFVGTLICVTDKTLFGSGSIHANVIFVLSVPLGAKF